MWEDAQQDHHEYEHFFGQHIRETALTWLAKMEERKY